jgi:type IV secretory pathway VirB2 component (pilin)
MREILWRPKGHWQNALLFCQRNTERFASRLRQAHVLLNTASLAIRFAAALALTFLLTPPVLAQPAPWERAASNLEQTFTGPLARSLALVAIVIGGLMFMFGEGGAKRQISGIVFGGGLALFATQFLTWLF